MLEFFQREKKNENHAHMRSIRTCITHGRCSVTSWISCQLLCWYLLLEPSHYSLAEETTLPCLG